MPETLNAITKNHSKIAADFLIYEYTHSISTPKARPVSSSRSPVRGVMPPGLAGKALGGATTCKSVDREAACECLPVAAASSDHCPEYSKFLLLRCDSEEATDPQ